VNVSTIRKSCRKILFSTLLIVVLIISFTASAVYATGGANKNPGVPVFMHAEALWDYYDSGPAPYDKDLVPTSFPGNASPLAITLDDAILDYFPSASSSGTGVFNTYLALKAPGSSLEERGVNTDPVGNQKYVFDEDGSKTSALPLSLVPIVRIGTIEYREFCVDVNQLSGLGHISLEVFQIWQTADRYKIGEYDATTHTLSDSTLIWDLDGGFRGFPVSNKTIVLDYAVNTGSGKPDYKLFVPDSWFDKTIPYVAMACDHGFTQTVSPGVIDNTPYFGYDNYHTSPLPVGCNDGFEEWGVRVIDTFQTTTTTLLYKEAGATDVALPGDGAHTVKKGDTIYDTATVISTVGTPTGTV